MESAKIYTHLVTIVIVIIVINDFQLEGCFQGHSIYNNKYIFIIIYTMRHFSSKMLNDIHDNDNHDHICTKN